MLNLNLSSSGKNMFDKFIKAALEKAGYKVPGSQKKKPNTMMVKENQFDDRTFAQLEAAKFSGIRANDLWNRFEFWILGKIAETVSYQQFWLRPAVLNETYCELFCLKEMMLDAATQREVNRVEERKAELDKLKPGELDRLASAAEAANKTEAKKKKD